MAEDPITLPISGRETTVLRLIAWGYTNKEIANRLAISVKTIEAHKANGMRKLNLAGRSGLVRQAVAWGWLTPEKSPDNDTQLWSQLLPDKVIGAPETR